MPLTHAVDLLCLQLNTAGSPIFWHLKSFHLIYHDTNTKVCILLTHTTHGITFIVINIYRFGLSIY